jgi:hypothetical protein
VLAVQFFFGFYRVSEKQCGRAEAGTLLIDAHPGEVRAIMIACYTDILSASAGATVQLFISSSEASCDLEIARVGRDRVVIHRQSGIAVAEQPIPQEADRSGCGWAASARFTVEEDWPSGYYDIVVTSPSGGTARHFICVRPAVRCARAVLILATNTYQAYNWWGGRNTYCDAGAVMDGRMTMAEALEHGLGAVSAERPFPPGILYVGPDAPRTINGGDRGFGELPVMPSRQYRMAHGYGPLDLSAGFINKWEHAFVVWCEENDVDLDYLTDHDVDSIPDVLDGYSAVLVVGHSEYWSGPQRWALDDFVDRGGKLAVFSGNTSYWKVRWDGSQMACHKSKGATLEAHLGAEATGWWSDPMFGHPEAELLGLSFLFGGYHRLGLCVSRGAGGYTIYDDRHWALEGADLLYGDVLGSAVPLLGYENDGCLLAFREDGGLRSVPQLGVPADLAIIGMAPTAYAEDPDNGYDPILAREKLNQAAEIVHGEATDASMRRILHGHAVMASFTRGKGEVFNAGTTEWAHALRARDPFIDRITRNVLVRFGAMG